MATFYRAAGDRRSRGGHRPLRGPCPPRLAPAPHVLLPSTATGTRAPQAQPQRAGAPAASPAAVADAGTAADRAAPASARGARRRITPCRAGARAGPPSPGVSGAETPRARVGARKRWYRGASLRPLAAAGRFGVKWAKDGDARVDSPSGPEPKALGGWMPGAKGAKRLERPGAQAPGGKKPKALAAWRQCPGKRGLLQRSPGTAMQQPVRAPAASARGLEGQATGA